MKGLIMAFFMRQAVILIWSEGSTHDDSLVPL